MRKIEKDMLYAFMAGRPFNKDNTRVSVYAEGVFVFLHDNLILEKDNAGIIKIYNRGWFTNTTKSRLNALLGAVNMGICQKKKQWYLVKNLFLGQWAYVPFVEGMTVNQEASENE